MLLYASVATLTQMYQKKKYQRKKTGRKDIIWTAGRERRMEGGRKDDRKQETTA